MYYWFIICKYGFNDFIESGEIIKNGLSKKTGAEALNNLTAVLDSVERVREDLQSVAEASENLKRKSDRLQYGLQGSKTRLLALLDECPLQKCVDLSHMPEIRSLRVRNNFQNVSFKFHILFCSFAFPEPFVKKFTLVFVDTNQYQRLYLLLLFSMHSNSPSPWLCTIYLIAYCFLTMLLLLCYQD